VRLHSSLALHIFLAVVACLAPRQTRTIRSSGRRLAPEARRLRGLERRRDRRPAPVHAQARHRGGREEEHEIGPAEELVLHRERRRAGRRRAPREVAPDEQRRERVRELVRA
jgi:hypothetical protein